jgi:hypothetical protein
VKRLPDEPVGKYEPESVPPNYEFVIPPTETLVGYTLPRLFIRQLGDNDLPQEERQARLMRGLDVIEDSAKNAQTPENLLALVAEGIAQSDVDPLETLSAVLPAGWYELHNAKHLVERAKIALEAHAPQLWQLYTSLSAEDRAAHKIL